MSEREAARYQTSRYRDEETQAQLVELSAKYQLTLHALKLNVSRAQHAEARLRKLERAAQEVVDSWHDPHEREAEWPWCACVSTAELARLAATLPHEDAH